MNEIATVERSRRWWWIAGVLVVLVAAGVIWFLLSRASAGERDAAFKAHEAQVQDYDSAWDELQEQVENAEVLMSTATEEGQLDAVTLAPLSERLDAAKGLERIEPEGFDGDVDLVAVRADTQRIAEETEIVTAAAAALGEEYALVQTALEERRAAQLDEARNALQAAIDAARGAIFEATGRADTATLEKLVADAEGLLANAEAPIGSLTDADEQIRAEVERVRAASRPRPEDVTGTWCRSSGECITIDGSSYSWQGNPPVRMELMRESAGCFEFMVGVGEPDGHVLTYCPAGVRAPGQIAANDDPSQDRIFEGQSLPMEMALRR